MVLALGWYIVPYARKIFSNPAHPPVRYCLMENYMPLIRADGGSWDGVEVMGNPAIVKVKADTVTLGVLDGMFTRIPLDDITASLNSLTNSQRTMIRSKILDMGYSLAEFNSRFPGNLGSYTLRDVLTFAASRRQMHHYDLATDPIVIDSDTRPCSKTIGVLDGEVL